MKKIIAVLFMLFILVGCGESEKMEFGKSNTEVIEDVSSQEKALGWTYAEIQIKQLYGLDKIKIKGDSENLKVMRMPDDKNSETGEEYKDVYSVRGNFTFQDHVYNFTMLYSLTDEDHYKVLYLISNYDDSKSISVPLASDN